MSRFLDRTVRELEPSASWNEVRRWIRTGKVRVDGATILEPTAPVPDGARVEVVRTAPRPPAPDALAPERLVYVDGHVVVVDKPPGIATVPFEDERDTLDARVAALLRKTSRGPERGAPLGVVQRLDRETSGLLVFARTLGAKRHLQQQLRVHSVHRRYLALAHGDVPARSFRSRLVADRGDGRRGSTDHADLGRDAVTHVRPLERLRGATLVECRLETGRTHQIRIHLAEAGHPLLGERVYTKGLSGPFLEAPRILLHAVELGFEHPRTGAPCRFERPMPADMAAVRDALRG